MKITIMIVDEWALEDTARLLVEAQELKEGKKTTVMRSMIQPLVAELRPHWDKWFKDSMYLTLEMDTEAGTCVVVPVKPEV